MICILHDWSQWEQFKIVVRITDTNKKTGKTFVSERRTEYWQKRKCFDCLKEQRERLS